MEENIKYISKIRKYQQILMQTDKLRFVICVHLRFLHKVKEVHVSHP